MIINHDIYNSFWWGGRRYINLLFLSEHLFNGLLNFKKYFYFPLLPSESSSLCKNWPYYPFVAFKSMWSNFERSAVFSGRQEAIQNIHNIFFKGWILLYCLWIVLITDSNKIKIQLHMVLVIQMVVFLCGKYPHPSEFSHT